MNSDFTPENAPIVAQYAHLTGFSQEELANWFLADYFHPFEDNCEETIGCK